MPATDGCFEDLSLMLGSSSFCCLRCMAREMELFSIWDAGESPSWGPSPAADMNSAMGSRQ